MTPRDERQARRSGDSIAPTLWAPPAKLRGEPGATSLVTPSLPLDLRQQATRRLRITALAYAGAFLLADMVPAVLMPEGRLRFQHLEGWLPSASSILLGLLVAALVGKPQLSWTARLNLGLAFQVAGSYGIAVAQCMWLRRLEPTPELLRGISSGWIGVWMVFHAVVLPAPPRRMLLTALGSATAMPVVLLAVVGPAWLSRATTPDALFFSQVSPYLICAWLAYLAAGVIYRLGADVSRARELGSYRLDHPLGRGGMGEVWKASHQLLARPAAIKFIRPEAIAGSNPDESATLLKRFEMEARATALLSSEHTIDLYDFGVAEDGTFYYVMELLDGVDLEELVRRHGPVPPARLVHLLVQACESLDEAHAKGLVHRDVKPANLYTCRSGRRCDFIKVLDFGLVASDRSLSASHGRLTRPDQMAGTPEYMPPEVARGGRCDHRVDLYAMGCVAYWLATGAPVFRGRTLYDVVSQHLQATPEPPSRHVPDGFPAALDDVILRCLEKDPEQRPADAQTLARMLRAVPLTDRWTDDEAAAWWQVHLPERAWAEAPGGGDPLDPTGRPAPGKPHPSSAGQVGA